MKLVKSRIKNFVKKHKKEIIETCAELVRINTVNPYAGDASVSSEKPGQLYLKRKCQELGGKVKLLPVPADIYQQMGVLGPADRSFKGRPNLVAEFNFGSGGKTVIVNGHMDTVGAEKMEIEPFSGQVKGGKIWGRGTTDCKGALTSALFAIKFLQEVSEELSGKVIYQSVVDEECSGSGAGSLALIKDGYKADYAIVVDGNGMQIVYGCAGITTVRMKVLGKGGHASYKYGVNAIDKACFLKSAIDQFKKKREKKFPQVKTTLGVFQSGSSPSVIPGEAVLGVNVGYDLSEAEKAEKKGEKWGGELVREEFEKIVNRKAEQDPWLKKNPPVFVWEKDIYPFSAQEDNPLIEIFQQSFQQILRTSPPVIFNYAWFDAAHFARQLKIPVIGFGPGKLGCSHSSAEHIEIEDLLNHCQVLMLGLYQLLKFSPQKK
jgi:acetylornithine deacetylase